MMYAYNVCILISNYWGEEMVTLSSPFHVSSLTHLSHRISVLMLLPRVLWLWICLYFHTSLSVQLNLTSVRMWIQKGNTAAKNNLQVEFRALLSLFRSLFVISASQSSRFFPPFMNIYGGVSIWSRYRAKIRPRIKIPPTPFPHCFFFRFQFFSLYLSLSCCEPSAGKGILTHSWHFTAHLVLQHPSRQNT